MKKFARLLSNKAVFFLFLGASAFFFLLQFTQLLRLTSDNTAAFDLETKSTHPFLPVSSEKNNNNATTTATTTTFVHCVGDNFLESSWQYKSCLYRNLCWQGDEWTILASPEQYRLEQDNLFSSSRLQQNLSTIGLTKPAWIRNKNYRWSPRILVSSSDDNLMTNNGADPSYRNAVVLIASVPPTPLSMFELLVNTLLPLYNLATMFDLYSSSHEATANISVHILNSHDIKQEYWADLKLGLKWMGHNLFLPPKSLSISKTHHCVSQVAAGIGRLTATGLTKRGYNTDDYQTTKIRNHGRGSLMAKFRNHICKNLAADSGTRINSTNTIRVAMPKIHPLKAPVLEGLKKHFSSWSVQAVDEDVQSTNAIQMAASSKVWIALSNNDTYTWPALFLPQNGHVVLLYDPKVTVKSKRRKSKTNSSNNEPVRQDFGLWNHMSHIKVHWLSLSHKPEALINLLLRIIEPDTLLDEKGGNGQQTTGEVSSNAGTFNGHNIRLTKTKSNASKSHCIGENWMWDAANHRSCHMEHFCFDLMEKRFTIDLPKLSKFGNKELLPTDFSSTHVSNENPKVTMGHSIRLGSGDSWFPDTTGTENFDYYYSLETNVVWLPFFAEQPNINNPGHLLWDYLLPLFTLTDIFQIMRSPNQNESKLTLLLTNLDPWCVSNASDTTCYNLITKFLPLMGADPDTFFSIHNSQLVVTDSLNEKESKGLVVKPNVVCAKHGLGGIGMLTDHGIKKHGQLLEDYKLVHNVGRGGQFWDFRNFMLRNMGMSDSPSKLFRPLKITFSINSSNNPSRRRDFKKQIDVAKHLFTTSNSMVKGGVIVQSVVMGDLSLQEQISIIQESAIFISVIGGSVSTALFVQRGTTLILYYNDIDDFVQGSQNMMPNRMDWDFWNNASWLKVHWLPMSSMDDEKSLNALISLLKNEIKDISSLYSEVQK